jgi:hypothetical protein
VCDATYRDAIRQRVVSFLSPEQLKKQDDEKAKGLGLPGLEDRTDPGAAGRSDRLWHSTKTVRRLAVEDAVRSDSILALSVDIITVVDGSLGQLTTRNVALTERRNG